jgi:hypothetical protein
MNGNYRANISTTGSHILPVQMKSDGFQPRMDSNGSTTFELLEQHLTEPPTTPIVKKGKKKSH